MPNPTSTDKSTIATATWLAISTSCHTRRVRRVNRQRSRVMSAAMRWRPRPADSCSRPGGPSFPHNRVNIAYIPASLGSLRRSLSAIPSRMRCCAAGKLIVYSKLSYLRDRSYPGDGAQTRCTLRMLQLAPVHVQADGGA
jgi:hypothetical protein